jgi:LasA protease
MKSSPNWYSVIFLVLSAFSLAACQSQSAAASLTNPSREAQPTVQMVVSEQEVDSPVPFPTRPPYSPGELVDYTAQTGDTLPALAVRFNTTVQEILSANTFIPADATTMPPGMPMKIPIYYLPFWNQPYKILPDSLFVNGPAQIDFDTQAFVDQYPGWLSSHIGFVSGKNRTGAQIVDMVALNYSISPRLLLALLEYQSGALTDPNSASEKLAYPLGYVNRSIPGLYLQLAWAANTLNHGYYSYRQGKLTTLELLNGRFERPDPWQNAATVSLQYFFSRLMVGDPYQSAISSEGISLTYAELFGDPWLADAPHIPGSLTQPDFLLPFEPRRTWSYTGGPHTGWGEGEPYAALDFAPPSVVGGCTPTNEWSTAVAAGVVARSDPALVILDLDGDGDERTGWAVLYLHVASEDQARLGAVVNAGDPLGRPSCEGGRATGTHIHIARKYNGEWLPAGGVLAFNLEGWIAENGAAAYLGTMTRHGRTIRACVCSDHDSHIRSDVIR